MKVNLDKIRRAAKKTVLIGMLLMVGGFAFGQSAQNIESSNPYVKLGQKALIDGDFKAAVTNLEKALPDEKNNLDLMYMLGYSQYQIGEYKKSIESFSAVLNGRPDDVNAYYYRAKVSNTLAADPQTKLNDKQRADLLESSIADYNKAIGLDDSDMKLYQNRAMAYRDLGNLVGTPTSKNYNKEAAATYYDGSIKDLETVLAKNPSRKDLNLELKKLKVYRSSL
ncbi:tetratricopeptide repeat protein [Albibacterium indicum]|uniref:tetratricopeptide repeat protein n=1 Tax=Albibacterium indicum TaxID=2292082 RepID=UPI000E505473|nr:tetratricopeptide repeat protein [Pedobacter indicus]